MSSIIKKLNTNCVSCNVLLNDKNMVKNRKNLINVLIILEIKIKNQLLNTYMKTIL